MMISSQAFLMTAKDRIAARIIDFWTDTFVRRGILQATLGSVAIMFA